MSGRGLRAETAALVVISPVRDEAAHIRLTLDSMLAQVLRPQEWIIVDDGSSDDTVAIVSEYAAEHPFIRVPSRPDRGARKLGAGMIEAFDGPQCDTDRSRGTAESHAASFPGWSAVIEERVG